MKQQGVVGTDDLLASPKIAAVLFRTFKKGVTHGILFPNPGYYMGQMLSMLPMLYTTRGLKSAVETPFSLVRNAPLISHLILGTSRGAYPNWAKGIGSRRVLVTNDGRAFSAADLIRIAKDGGIDETAVRVENVQQLTNYLRTEAKAQGPMNPLRIVFRSGREWQRIIDSKLCI